MKQRYDLNGSGEHWPVFCISYNFLYRQVTTTQSTPTHSKPCNKAWDKILLIKINEAQFSTFSAQHYFCLYKIMFCFVCFFKGKSSCVLNSPWRNISWSVGFVIKPVTVCYAEMKFNILQYVDDNALKFMHFCCWPSYEFKMC